MIDISKEELMWAVIQKLLFVPYKWGGDDPMAGFDCSGGVQEILASVGIDPRGDQTADMLMKHFMKEENGSAQPYIYFGDLLFFGKGLKSTHVAIAVSEDVMFEFGGGGSKTVDLDSAKAHNAYGRFRRIDNRKDLLMCVRVKELGG